MAEPITLVSGFGRCGSSLVMQMLHAGGMPVTGEARYPAFEDDRVMAFPRGHSWLCEAAGRAVKVLDPHRFPPPHPVGKFNYRWIWLDRQPEEQAKSFLKFTAALFPIAAPATPEMVARIAASYVSDRPKAHQVIQSRGDSLLTLAFEDILAYPWEATARLNQFCGGELDVERMRAAVIGRPVECLPMLLEFDQIQEAAKGAPDAPRDDLTEEVPYAG